MVEYSVTNAGSELRGKWVVQQFPGHFGKDIFILTYGMLRPPVDRMVESRKSIKMVEGTIYNGTVEYR